MASQALTAFNTRVDASALPDAFKTTLKNWGEILFVAGCREAMLHYRKHLLAKVNDPSLTNAQRQAAQAKLNEANEIGVRPDFWWLDLSEE